jgi:hypothetical protein
MSRRGFRRMAAVGAGGIVMALVIASPAFADTSAATASALQITLVGGGVASSGTTTASNDGTTETLTGVQSPALAVLGAQTVITAGVLGQVSRAFNDGTSTACAGVVGTGGSITVGATGVCTVNNGSEVTLTLGVAAGATIALKADAVYATCSADSTPAASGTTTLVNARITSTILGVETILLNLPANPGPNSGLTVPPLLNVTLNAQSSTGPGQINVTALNISALSGTLASIVIGNVTCGPNAVAPPVPAIPMAGAPIALGLVAIGVTTAFWLRRRAGIRTANRDQVSW